MEDKIRKQYDRQNDWRRKNTVKYAVTLSKNKDAEMIAFLESKKGKGTYIRRLIEADMRKAKYKILQ